MLVWLRVIEPVLQEDVNREDRRKPLFRSLEGAHSEASQTQMLLDVEVV